MLISCDSAHIHLSPTVLVHVSDHKQHTHSSTGDTPPDTARRPPETPKDKGVGSTRAQECVTLMGICVCVCV